MRRKFRIAYFTHAIRSDWNNGNAHFLRGLLRSLQRLGHSVHIYEPADDWSITNLRQEADGLRSLALFQESYPELRVVPYSIGSISDKARWYSALENADFVILHEWNPPALANLLVELRTKLDYRLLFHDTHHRAASSPEQIQLLRVDEADAILAFGEALKHVYQRNLQLPNVYTLHEAADTEVFQPIPNVRPETDAVWIGNWGDGERASEIHHFLLSPASSLPRYKFRVYGVRYPEEGLTALEQAGVRYCGYLPNLCAPEVYAFSKLTFHIPRQQYSQILDGIPTIRVFEALACGIPLISAPWNDCEHLFDEGDFAWAHSTEDVMEATERLLSDPDLAHRQAERGRRTVLSRHTCMHRAVQLTSIFEELSS